MSDRALSREALLAGLRDIHLPEQAAGGGLADLLAAIALGGVAALLLVVVLRALSRRVKPTRPATLHDHIAALQSLPEPDRRIALLHLLKARAPARFAELKQALYRPDQPIPPEELEQELLRHA